MHESVWDCTFGLNQHLDCFTGELQLAINHLLLTSILIGLTHLEVQSDLLQVGVELPFCWILKLRGLLDVCDLVVNVNFLHVNQWNPLACVHVHKEDLHL
jgi:hypothetical protein